MEKYSRYRDQGMKTSAIPKLPMNRDDVLHHMRTMRQLNVHRYGHSTFLSHPAES